MARVPATCPNCQDSLRVERLACQTCDTRVEGRFELPRLLRLAPDDLRFVTAFVRASGSLKKMAELEGQSYPTIRNRLDSIIQELEERSHKRETERLKVLDSIANAIGTMLPSQLTEIIKKRSISVLFQPILDMANDDVVGHEGTVPPAQIVRLVPNPNVGVMLGVMVTLKVVVVAHCPAVGVKV